MKKIILLIPLVTLLFSCNDKDLIGTWLMHKVVQNGEDVTAEHNPNNSRYFIIKSDSTFESGGEPFGKNTGKITFHGKTNKLYLDSDAGPDDDSQWIVKVSNDTMYWQGFGTEWAQDFQLIHVRKNN